MTAHSFKFLAIGLLAISLGRSTVSAETAIKIEGLRDRSENEVMQLIGDRFYYIREKEATSWRANDAAFLVEQVLENDGHLDAKVVAKVVSKDRIVIDVDEGRRLSLGEIEVRGVEDKERLQKLFALPAKKDTPLGFKDAPFRENDTETGLKFVRQELQSQGYWEARVDLLKQDIDRETGKVNVSLDVNQGPLFKLGRSKVESADWRGLKRTAITADPFIGEVATTENVNKLRASVVEAFTSRGYPDAKITMNRRLEGSTFYPEFFIDLGVRVKLLDVKVEGLERTRPEAVERLVKPLEGEWYDEAAMNEKVKRLLSSGAFSSARVETYEVARKRIDATLHMTEAKAKEIKLSAGAGSFVGPIVRAEYIDRNFQGRLKGLSAGIELSGLGALGELKLTDPWWYGTDIAWDIRLFALNRAYDGYGSLSTGIETNWKWEATDHYKMELGLSYAFYTVSEDGLPRSLLGETDYSNLTLRWNQTLDYRDSPILPKSGWHFSTPLEIGSAIGDDTSNYVKAGIEGGYYFPLGKQYSLGIGGSAIYVHPSGELSELPVDLRVFNGGARSVRSFPERGLGPKFKGDPYGGDFAWVVNTELTRQLTGAVSAVAFFDAGATTGDYIAPQEGGLELAAGLGIRIELPIGPVRLEYGQNLTQGPKEPSGTFHFAIGSTF